MESVSSARDVGSQLARRHMLAQVLPTAHIGSVCRARHLLRRVHHTRMMGMGSLSVPHAELVAGLSESKCSHVLCPPHTSAPCAMRGTSCGGRRPNDGMVESVIPARAAGNQLVRQRMLAQSVPPRTNFLPAQTCYHQLVGYGGLPPCSPFALDLSHPNAGNLAMRLAPMVPIRP